MTCPKRTDQKERCIVFDAIDEAMRLLQGSGLKAAQELLFGARSAWQIRCDDIEGTPARIFERLRKGNHLQRAFAVRTMQQACRLLSDTSPDLLVNLGRGRYCFPFKNFKEPASSRLKRLECWRREKWCGRRKRSEGESTFGQEIRTALSADSSIGERVAAARKEIERQGPAIQGQGGNCKTYRVACILGDYGLVGRVAWEEMKRYNAGCQPPWSEDELAKILASAERNRKRPRECKIEGGFNSQNSSEQRDLVQAGAAECWSRFWAELLSLKTLEADGPVKWLESRKIDPSKVESSDLARVLPGSNRRLPDWARVNGQSWAEAGFRLILPVYDSDGRIGGVRGRRTGPMGLAGAVGGPQHGEGVRQIKEVSPSRLRSTGFVFANLAARAMLSGGGVLGVVKIVEGAPDFLTMATLVVEPVIGVFAGAWTSKLAERVPDGADVQLATHFDCPGMGYSKKIVETLRGRCNLFRLKLPTGLDLNDVHCRGELHLLETESI